MWMENVLYFLVSFLHLWHDKIPNLSFKFKSPPPQFVNHEYTTITLFTHFIPFARTMRRKWLYDSTMKVLHKKYCIHIIYFRSLIWGIYSRLFLNNHTEQQTYLSRFIQVQETVGFGLWDAVWFFYRLHIIFLLFPTPLFSISVCL